MKIFEVKFQVWNNGEESGWCNYNCKAPDVYRALAMFSKYMKVFDQTKVAVKIEIKEV